MSKLLFALRFIIALLVLVIITSACQGKAPTGPTPISSTPGSLTVTINGHVGATTADLSGTVTAFGLGNTTKIIENGAAVFNDLEVGDYRVSAVAFGFASAEQMVTIKAGTETRLDLTIGQPVWEFKFLEVRVNGHTLRDGDVVHLPADIEVIVKLMNPNQSPAQARSTIQAEVGTGHLVGSAQSQPLPFGIQEGRIIFRNFRPCSIEGTGRCYSSSRYLLFSYREIGSDEARQKNQEFFLRYE